MKSVDVSEVLSCCIHLNNVFSSKRGINTEQVFLSLSLISLQWAAPPLAAAMELSVTNTEIQSLVLDGDELNQFHSTVIQSSAARNPSTQPAAVQQTLIDGCVKTPDLIDHIVPTRYLMYEQ